LSKSGAEAAIDIQHRAGHGLVGRGDVADGHIGAFIGERAGAGGAPMPRDPPVMRAILPARDLVIGFLRCLNFRWALDMLFPMVHK
jgi:hypothetical protein